MKKIIKAAATLILTLTLSCTVNRYYTVESSDFDGMFFSSDCVIDTFCYGPKACFLLYDDPDAEIAYQMIRVDQSTYKRVSQAIYAYTPVKGTLRAQPTDETTEYTLRTD